MSILRNCSKYRKRNDYYLFLIALLPATYLIAIYLFDDAETNVFRTLMTFSGHWAISFYLASYAVSPFQRTIIKIASARQWTFGKRLTDWNFLLTHRRTLGIASFHLCTWHLLIYLYLELDLLWSEYIYELANRGFILVGSIAYIIMSIMYVTSFVWAKKIVGKYWKPIHNLTHLVVVTIVFHIVWASKIMLWFHYVYISLFSLLLIERLCQLGLGRDQQFFAKQSRRRKIHRRQ